MSLLQPPRGTHDLLPQECLRDRYVSGTFQKMAKQYGFWEVETPMFEFAHVFRHLGETSDVVTKETYTFSDRSGEEMTLRPEGTAGVARMVITNGLAQHAPLKYFYSGPMFRYDRPQKGRYRQFDQFGVELLGVSNPLGDAEVIAMAAQGLHQLGILQDLTLELNTLGDRESRDQYRTVLVSYFKDHLKDLSPESLIRLDKNPLRILDSKEACDQPLIAQAPLYTDHLNGLSQDFFGKVKEGLNTLGIAFVHNPKLVRGLDYYCHTAFEFISRSDAYSGTVLAGGRYDTLVSSMGGPDLPGIGWAAGVGRIGLLMENTPQPSRPIVVIPMGETELPSFKIIQDLRHAGFRVDMGYSGNMGKRLKRADKLSAQYAIIVGEDEYAQGMVLIRSLDEGTQISVSLDKIIDYFKGLS